MTEPILAIVGPTGSGKSQLAQDVCVRIGGEIISCDSVQVYRGFEIGCAKPSAVDRAQVPHHLIDVVDWNDAFDAARYVTMAQIAIADIQSRGAIPVLCGGTGLYLRALRFGLVDVPPKDESIRARLRAEETASPGVLYARLHEVDPEGAKRQEPFNIVQIIRSLEIYEQTGEPASLQRKRHGFRREQIAMHVVSIEHEPQILANRIIKRTHGMIDAGLLHEVASLLKHGVSEHCRPMNAVGYRECAQVIREQKTIDGLVDRIVHATRRYAKRQRTWFRKERNVTRINTFDLQKLRLVGNTLIPK